MRRCPPEDAPIKVHRPPGRTIAGAIAYVYERIFRTYKSEPEKDNLCYRRHRPAPTAGKIHSVRRITRNAWGRRRFCPPAGR